MWVMASPPDIIAATAYYEHWLGVRMPLIKAEISVKHAAMAADPFSFFRATYYRWAQLWPAVCTEAVGTPKFLSAGDLHVENFGTWRDAEARLVWGVNDFDEAGMLPWTNDLVRLAVSALVAIGEDHLSCAPRDACDALWEGYFSSVKQGGRAFVLEEEHAWLRKLAISKLRDPAVFWKKLGSWPTVTRKTPPEVMEVLRASLPGHDGEVRVVHRQAGLGSLGRPRYTALFDWNGGKAAREAKAIAPNGVDWKNGADGTQPKHLQRMIAHPLRSTDPMNYVNGDWVLRRLSPHCSRIELASLPAGRDEEALLNAMGWETANGHISDTHVLKQLKQDIAKRPAKWLYQAASTMLKATLVDWKNWRKHGKQHAVKARR